MQYKKLVRTLVRIACINIPVSSIISMAIFCTLPNELLLRIFSTLDINDIRQVAPVCKRFSQLFQEEYLWKMLLIHHYGPSKLPPSNAGISYRTAYLELRLSVCIADSFYIMNNVPRYWRAAETEDRLVIVRLALNILSN
jgi:hypothetical protein